jgi:hypothetical protein
VIGREFDHALVAAAAGMVPSALEQGLRDLTDAGLIFARGALPEINYTFKHALVQDAAYGSLLKSRRQQLHGHIAAILEQRLAAAVEQQSELLAHHHFEAGSVERAIYYWSKAARRSLAQSALAEAVQQTRKGIALLSGQPDGPARWRHELDLQMTLSACLEDMKGTSAPDLIPVYTRASELSAHLGDTVTLALTLKGRGTAFAYRAEFDKAWKIAADLLQLKDRFGQMVGNHFAGWCCHWMGNFTPGTQHLQQTLKLYVAEDLPLVVTTLHPRIAAFGFLAIDLFILGYPDRAAPWGASIVSEARTLEKPSILAYGHWLSGLYHLHRHDAEKAYELSRQLISLATQLGFGAWMAQGRLLAGCLSSRRGEVAEGLAITRQGSRKCERSISSAGKPCSWACSLNAASGPA